MKVTNRHIIRKQVFDLQLDQEQLHHQLSEQLKLVFKQSVLPQLSTLFDQLAVDHTIQIEKLEIKLPKLQLSDWATRFPKLLLEQLEQQIRQQIPVAPRQITAANDDVQVKDSETALLEAFVYFCQHGVFPWWFDRPDLKTFEERLLRVQRDRLQKLVQQLLRQEDVATRLVWQFSTSFYEALMTGIAKVGVSQPIRKNWTIVILSLSLQNLSATDLTHLIKVSWLKAIFIPRFSETLVEKNFLFHLVSAIVSRVEEGEEEIVDQWIQSFPTERLETVFVRSASETLVWFRKYIAKSEDSEATVSDDPSGLDDPMDTTSPESNEIQQLRVTRENDSYIQNSGLILLAPFLPRLFDRVGFTQNDKFVNQSAKEQAVLLTQHLVDGHTEWNEHHLLLNKVICAYPLGSPIPSQLDLSEEMKEQSQALLKAVIQHWQVLKNTSAEGLRGAFIQREGKLSDQGKHWLLTVNRQTFDILLDQIPWTIQIIKLPWMKSRLQVDW